MKINFKHIVLSAGLLITLQNTSAQTPGKGIQFFKGTLNEALAEAKKQNKPIFADLYAVWCVPCKRMEKQVFTIDSIGDYFNSKFINIQIDAEKNADIAKRYKVESFPTLAFITPDGKAISIKIGAMNAAQLMEAAKAAVGEAIDFEQLYQLYKQDNTNLDVQQQLLLKAPSFLTAQDGMDADKWVTRIQKIYQNYIAAKKGPKLINKNDYIIFNTLEDDKAKKQEMMDFVNENLTAWKQAVGNPAAYYVVENNDQFIDALVKEGNIKYKEYVEKVNGAYKEAYAVVSIDGITPYERIKTSSDALFNLYKKKDTEGYIKAMGGLLEKLGANATAADYGKAAQDLYYAAGEKLATNQHKQAIKWVEKALSGQNSVMDRVNYLVMIGDSYRAMKDYAKAREYYNQGYAESLQMTQMEDVQQMIQGAVQQKLATLELLEK